jgi:hypothetical protein
MYTKPTNTKPSKPTKPTKPTCLPSYLSSTQFPIQTLASKLTAEIFLSLFRGRWWSRVGDPSSAINGPQSQPVHTLISGNRYHLNSPLKNQAKKKKEKKKERKKQILGGAARLSGHPNHSLLSCSSGLADYHLIIPRTGVQQLVKQ